MKHWDANPKKNCITLKDLGYQEDRVLSLTKRENGMIEIREECDGYFNIVLTRNNARRLLTEALSWVSALSVWSIYDKPRDYPEKFVARRFESSAAGAIATKDVLFFESLEECQAHFEALGMQRIGRSVDDDPVIVETWV